MFLASHKSGGGGGVGRGGGGGGSRGGVGVGRRVDLQSTSVIKVIAKVGNVTGKGGRREEGGATSRGKYGSFSTGQEGRRQSKYRTRGERERERLEERHQSGKACLHAAVSKGCKAKPGSF